MEFLVGIIILFIVVALFRFLWIGLTIMLDKAEEWGFWGVAFVIALFVFFFPFMATFSIVLGILAPSKS